MGIFNLEQTELGLIAGGTYSSIPTVDSLIGGPRFNHNFLVALVKEAVSVNSPLLERTLKLVRKIEEEQAEVLERTGRLKRRTTDLYFNLRNTQAVEKNIPSYIKQIGLDLNVRELFTDTSSVLFKDDKILGINTSPTVSPDHSNQTLDIYPLKDLKVFLSDSFSASTGVISAAVINTNAPFFIQATSPIYNRSRRFELVIDRVLKTPINHIDISLEEAHIIEVQSSSDGINYTPIFNDRIYVKNSVIPFTTNTDQYLKIIFYKNSSLSSTQNNGDYTYRIKFNYLFIAGVSINDESEFITKAIDPQIQGLSGISLDTCDNYQDKNVDISYFVDFNNEEDWKELKPINKIKDSKKQIRSYIRVNDYYDNKVIRIPRELGTLVDNQLEYQVDLESEFLETNQIKVFTDRLDGTSIQWVLKDGFYSIYSILNTAKELTINNLHTIYINKIPYLGESGGTKIRLDAGIYEIRIPSTAYHYIFNPFLYDIVSVDNAGNYVLKAKDTGAITNIQDIYYPYDLKLNIELLSDFLFKTQLIENKDFSIYNNLTSNKIRTQIHKDIFVLYRLFEEDATGFTFRLKGVYKSLNKLTIPYTDRINIRLI